MPLFNEKLNSLTALDQGTIIELTLHSLVLGVLLFLIILYTQYKRIGQRENGLENAILLKGLVSLSSNLIFLCVGLTSVMILVNNNLARAFSIGAAIALIRFRTKLESNDQSHAILFAIIIGIACGLNELLLAWILFGIFSILCLSLNFIFIKINQKTRQYSSGDFS